MKNAGLGFIILFILLIIPSVSACSCARGTSLDNIKRHDIVFAGWVQDSSFGLNSHSYSFSTSFIYKGDVPSTINIETAANSAACGTSFEKQKSYLVFAEGSEDGGYRTGLCSGNMLIGSEEYSNFLSTYMPYIEGSTIQNSYERCKIKDTQKSVFKVVQYALDTSQSRLYDSSGNMIDSSFEGMTPIQKPLQTELENCQQITRTEFEQAIFYLDETNNPDDPDILQPVPQEPIPYKGFWTQLKEWFANLFN